MKTITEEKLKEQMFIKALYLHLPEEVVEQVTKEIDTYCKQEIESACKMQREICAETYFKGTKKKHTYEDDMNTIRNAPSPEGEQEMKRHYCSDCGKDMDEGEGSVFTCCESCWDKHYGEIEGTNKMSIANKGVYPFSLADTGAPMTFGLGLTYREWLIGMLASNAGIMNSALEETKALIKNEFEFAKVVIGQADAIIKQLDKESGK